jgi:hypothetical protein
MAAAVMPIRNVSIPARHQGAGDQWLLSEPMAKKVKPVIVVEAQIEAGAPAMKGRSGTEPRRIKARKVMIAALPGERLTRGSPCSSVIIVSISARAWR